MAITWPLPDTAQFRQSICSLSDRGHGVGAHRRLRDLHIGLDVEAHEIVAVELTPDDVSVTCSKIPTARFLMRQRDQERDQWRGTAA
jgi:hypothetical protein